MCFVVKTYWMTRIARNFVSVAAPVPELATQFGFESEFVASDGHPRDAIAFLRRVESTAGHLPDEALSENLLGLSFLSKLRRFEYANGRLVMEQ